MSYFIKLFFYFTLMSSSIVHASDTKAGLPQLDLSTYPSLMFWAVISLIIGYFLMSFLVAPNIKSILNLRETNIQNDLVKAKASTQENEKIKQEIIDHQKDIKFWVSMDEYFAELWKLNTFDYKFEENKTE